MDGLLKWISANPAIASALIAGAFLLTGGFLVAVVWPLWLEAIRNGSVWLERVFKQRHFEERFLDWMIREHRFLPILPTTLVPVTETHHHELDRLYVELTVAEGSESLTRVDLFQAGSRLIVLGDPGAGKTTMLRFLALTFARARRNKPSGDSTRDRRIDESRVREARTRVREAFELRFFPLPVFVFLNRLRDVAEWPKGRSLLDALRDEWKAVDSLRDFPERFFQEKLQRGECIFLFDAYDELGTKEARDAIARHIGDLANSAPTGNRFIVTSRIVGYSGQLAQYGFRALTVEHLSWQLVADLVHRWYTALKEPQLAQSLLETLEANPRISELAANPMLLSLIVLVQYVKRIIPERRDLLYDECVGILVERRFAPPSVQAVFNNILEAQDAISVLRKVARTYHESRLREMPRELLQAQVIGPIVDRMTKSTATKLAPSEILRNIEDRSQILVERGLNEHGQPVIAFSHMTFQEYLASADLRRESSVIGQASVTDILLKQYAQDPEWWEEVALLYAAQLDRADQDIFFQQLYPAPPIA